MPFSEVQFTEFDKQQPFTISTPRGNAVIEIQGELVLPDAKPDGLNEQNEKKFTKIESDFITAGDLTGVDFGRLELEGKKATLFIGTSQRLIGDLKEINPPLALLKMSNDQDDETNNTIEIVDVIKYKVIFTGRPLPIM